MTLSALIRKRDTGNLATAIPAISATQPKGEAATVARIATVAVANPKEEKTAPLPTVGAGNTAPPAKVSPGDTATASRWWLIHYHDRDPLPVSFSPEVTHAEALASYPDAVAAEPIAPPPPIETSCRDCRHFARPGHSSGYCAGRDDLPLAYGANHPLRRLPADRGVSCNQWLASE